MQGEIFNIQKFCSNDGPGIRTTVFLKGCPLRCLWCHNPESQNFTKEILFYSEKCTGCGRCKNLTTEDAEFLCYNDAKEICGKTVTSEYIIDEVMKDLEFYKTSGGGITLSGGEPLAQFDFALDILKKSKENHLHTAIETCGFVKEEQIIKISEYVDLFLYDFKESDAEKHKQYTGVGNELIIENLNTLNNLQKNVYLRCPIIPTYNDRCDHYDKIAELSNTFSCIKEINIEPYHSFGENKYIALNKDKPDIKMPEESKVAEIISYISSKTSVPVTKA